MTIIKNRTVPGGKEFWDHVEEVAGVSTPVPEPEPEFRCICPIVQEGPYYSLKIVPECIWHSPAGFARRRAEAEPPARKDELGTIETVLFRRALQRRLDGYTLETATEILAALKAPVAPQASPEAPAKEPVDWVEAEKRLAKFIAVRESRNCKTLDEALYHQSKWERILPEAREMLDEVFLPETSGRKKD